MVWKLEELYRSINNNPPLKVWAGGPKSGNLSLLLLSQKIFACGAALIISNFLSPKIDLRKSWFLHKKMPWKTQKKIRLRCANNTQLLLSQKKFACGAALIIFNFQKSQNLMCSYYLNKKGDFIINWSVVLRFIVVRWQVFYLANPSGVRKRRFT